MSQPNPKAGNPYAKLILNDGGPDLFAAPPNSLLLHACNCKGVWGGGIALEFKSRFPNSFAAYFQYCKQGLAQGSRMPFAGNGNVLGKAFVGSPEGTDGHRVVCLMTSKGYGKTRGTTPQILEATELALRDLVGQLKEEEQKTGIKASLHCCKFNSGKFGVEWEETVKVMSKVAEECDGLEVWVY